MLDAWRGRRIARKNNITYFPVFFYIGPRWSYCLLARSVALFWLLAANGFDFCKAAALKMPSVGLIANASMEESRDIQ